MCAHGHCSSCKLFTYIFVKHFPSPRLHEDNKKRSRRVAHNNSARVSHYFYLRGGSNATNSVPCAKHLCLQLFEIAVDEAMVKTKTTRNKLWIFIVAVFALGPERNESVDLIAARVVKWAIETSQHNSTAHQLPEHSNSAALSVDLKYSYINYDHAAKKIYLQHLIIR